MKIRMAFQITGTRNGLKWPEAGKTIDLPEGEANDLISTGAAEPAEDDEPEAPAPVLEVRPAPVPERAVVPEPRQPRHARRSGRR